MSSPPVNHVHPSSLLGTPDFPREPLPSSSYRSPTGYSPHIPPPEQVGRYGASPGRRQGVWHYDNPAHNFTTPSQTRDMFSRSLSTGEHHLPAQHYRRHSEHLERYAHHSGQQRDSMHPLMATPTYPGVGNPNRGRLAAHRGFQLSLEAAHSTGAYGGGVEGGGSPASTRKYSQGHNR